MSMAPFGCCSSDLDSPLVSFASVYLQPTVGVHSFRSDTTSLYSVRDKYIYLYIYIYIYIYIGDAEFVDERGHWRSIGC